MMLKHTLPNNNHLKENSSQSFIFNSIQLLITFSLIFYHRVVSIAAQAEPNINKHGRKVFSSTVCEVFRKVRALWLPSGQH